MSHEPAQEKPRDERHPWLRRGFWAWLALALLFSALSCKRQEPKGAVPEKLVVFAATSLRDAFTAMSEDFRRAHPDVEVQLNFAGTQELHTQLDHGAAADVFASADQRHMQELLHVGRVTAPVTFARNEPVLVVAQEKADNLRVFSDLPRADRIIIGVPEVPIGRYTLQILERASQSLGTNFRARVEAKIISRELNVRQVLSKVSLGEADAGIVYRSDTSAAAKGVTVLAIPPEINVVAEYPIALVSEAKHPASARAWLAWVLSDQGRARLAAAGFSVPAPTRP
jgi:molybdate transport system substrate-binding protein